MLLRTLVPILLMTTGCTVYHTSTPRARTAHHVQVRYAAPTAIRVNQAPPPPQVAVASRPAAVSANSVWIAGYWKWTGQWVWEPGHWEAGHDGYEWEAPCVSTAADGGYTYHEGHWRPRGATPPPVYRASGTIRVAARPADGGTITVRTTPTQPRGTVRTASPTGTVTVRSTPAQPRDTVTVRTTPARGTTRAAGTVTVRSTPTEPRDTVTVRTTPARGTVRTATPRGTVRTATPRGTTTRGTTTTASPTVRGTTTRGTTTTASPTVRGTTTTGATVRANPTARGTTTTGTTVRAAPTVRGTTTMGATVAAPAPRVRGATVRGSANRGTTVRANPTVRQTPATPMTTVNPARPTVRGVTTTPTVRPASMRPAVTDNPNPQASCRPAVARVPRNGRVVLRGSGLGTVNRVRVGGRTVGIVRAAEREVTARMTGSGGPVVINFQDGREMNCGSVSVF